MQMALKAVRLLLKHRASTDLLCDGHSPLSLAIISGNDMVCKSVYADITLHEFSYIVSYHIKKSSLRQHKCAKHNKGI